MMAVVTTTEKQRKQHRKDMLKLVKQMLDDPTFECTIARGVQETAPIDGWKTFACAPGLTVTLETNGGARFKHKTSTLPERLREWAVTAYIREGVPSAFTQDLMDAAQRLESDHAAR